MKLAIVIVHDDDVAGLLKALVRADFRATKLSTSGGFLKAGNTTLLIGLPDEQLDELIKIIEDSCMTRKEMVTTPPLLGEGMFSSMPIEITVGGATIFVLSVDKFIHL